MMRAPTHYSSDPSRATATAALVGIAAGFGLLLPALLVPDLRILVAPAFAVLVPSLLLGLR